MSQKKFAISKSLSLPINALTQRFACLARTGAGKSYTAQKIAEGFLKLLQQIVVIDPNGAWWGLRTAADGKGKGFPILIMGGDHGDVPLEPTAGALVADLVINEGVSVILDLSKFETDADEARFVTAFIDRLFRKNRHPIHLFVDEADSFAPQAPQKSENLMLNRMARLAKRGRSKGIGMTLISQRSAAISKRVLSQTEIMIAMQTTDPRDKKAIGEWMQGRAATWGADKDWGQEILAQLPTLKIGEAWIWSPSFLKVCMRIKISEKKTFDSSATPEVGVKTRKVKLVAEVDIKKLSAQIAGTIEKANAEDPKLLQKQVRELQSQLKTLALTARVKKAYSPEGVDTKAVLKDAKGVAADLARAMVQLERLKKQKVKTFEIPVLPVKTMMQMEQVATKLKQAAVTTEKAAANIRGHVDKLIERIEHVSREIKTAHALGAAAAQVELVSLAKTQDERDLDTRVSIHEDMRKPKKAVLTSETDPDGIRLKTGEKGILQALHQLGGVASEARIGMLAGFPSGGSTFKTYRNVLKRYGLVTKEGDDLILNPVGVTFVPDPSATQPRSTDELVEMWRSRLKSGEFRMLTTLVEVYPKRWDEKALMGHLDMKETTYKTYRNVLKKIGLAVVEDGALKASSYLFEQEE